MKLYDKQKTFEIKQFTKGIICYHKPFYTNGTFMFNEKYLKVTNALTEFSSADRWGLQSGVFYYTDTPDLYKLIAELAPTNPDDEKLIPCYMEPMLKGLHNFKLIVQLFSYGVNGEERIKYVNVDFLQYININNCFFRTTASPTSPILIYDINTSEFVGLIMLCIIR